LIELLRVLFPTAAILYYVIKGVKQKLFFLGIPFIMYMANSVIFSKHFTNILNKPGSIESEARLFLWLLIVWGICKKSKYMYKMKRFRKAIFLSELPVYAILVFAFIHIVIASGQQGSPFVVYLNARSTVFMVFGYFMIKQIFSFFSQDIVNQFIKSLIVLSSISILLFVLHQGFGIKIFPYEEYAEFTFQQVQMTRTFTIISPLLIVVYAYSLVTANNNRSSIIILLLTISAIMVSYTRTLIVIGIIILLVYLMLNMERTNNIKKVASKTILPLVLIGIGLIVFMVLMPKQYSYLSSRVSEVTESFSGYDNNNVNAITSVHNVDVRKEQFNTLYENASSVQRIYGNGYSQEMAGTSSLISVAADSDWQAVFMQFGIVGIILFGLMQGIFLLLGIRLIKVKHQDEAITITGFVISLLIIGNFIFTFSSWVYLTNRGMAFSLWPFALLASEAQRSNSRSFPSTLGKNKYIKT